MTEPKENYTTEKAWEGAENPETKYWRNMAEHFRKENKELKKKLQQLQKTKAVRRLNEQEVHFEMKLAEQDCYIVALEKKIESLRQFEVLYKKKDEGYIGKIMQGVKKDDPNPRGG